MILHLASFRWNDDVSEEDVAEATQALRDMAARIDVLRSYVAGTNLHLRPGGADFGVVAIVDDAAGLDAYLDHPLHAEVYERYLGRMIAERSAAQLPLAAGALS